MNTDAHPPIRTTQTQRRPGGTWRYDTWGTTGRPILFLHSVLFDRTMWWPAAAELHPYAVPVAVDLPGHGESPARRRYDPHTLVDELGEILAEQGPHQAPIVVGHGASAGLASLFAVRFVTRALVLIDPYVATYSPRLPVQRRALSSASDFLDLLDTMATDFLPSYLHDFARPRGDAALLAAYRRCAGINPWSGAGTDGPMAAADRLIICSQPPTPAALTALRNENNTWRCRVFDHAVGFPHLSDIARFCAEIRALL